MTNKYTFSLGYPVNIRFLFKEIHDSFYSMDRFILL